MGGGEIGGVEKVCLGLKTARNEEKVLGHNGKLVEDKEMCGLDGANGQSCRRVLEGVEGRFLGSVVGRGSFWFWFVGE